MQTTSTIAVTLITVAALAGCNRSQPVDPRAQAEAAAQNSASAPSHVPAGIDWFDGGVEAAFAKAQKEDKPVLLYWARRGARRAMS